MISELLTIQTHIYNVKGILIIEKWNIWEFTGYFFLFIYALCTDPIGNLILNITFSVTLKTDSNTLTVLLNQRMQWHIKLCFCVSMSRSRFRLYTFHTQLLWIYKEFFLIWIILFSIQCYQNFTLCWILYVFLLSIKVWHLTEKCACLMIKLKFHFLCCLANPKNCMLDTNICITCSKKCHLCSTLWRNERRFKVGWS